LDDVGLDPGLLPSLQELVPEIEVEKAVNAFTSFIDICLVAGRLVRLSPLPFFESDKVALGTSDIFGLFEACFGDSDTIAFGSFNAGAGGFFVLASLVGSLIDADVRNQVPYFMPAVQPSHSVEFHPSPLPLQSASGIVSALRTGGRVMAVIN
jgi:hypothetical protein